MQSGLANSRKWVLEFAKTGERNTYKLMGWTGVNNTLGQIKLSFENQEAAIAFAERKGLEITLVNPKERLFAPKSYEENFTKNIS